LDITSKVLFGDNGFLKHIKFGTDEICPLESAPINLTNLPDEIFVFIIFLFLLHYIL